MASRAALALAAAWTASAAAPPALQFVPITDAAVRWVGRRYPMAPQAPPNALDKAGVNASTAYAVDWEGTEAEIGVVNATVVAAVLYDGSSGNTRWAVYLNSLNVSSAPATAEVLPGDPNP